ncbi:MAG: hypothetical protein CXT73_04595 [Methanobacteriota archaeon]|nr:MAG: hypothetical protein CXT73_04595 [Euryarchaeota archaeon]
MNKRLKNLKTGDLLLCSWHTPPCNSCCSCCFNIFDRCIQWGSHSNWTHSAVVLKDPTFIHPALKGLYVWESSSEGLPDPQDGKKKIGVQITPIHELINSYKGRGVIIVRPIHSEPNLFTDKNLKQVHDVVYGKSYDLNPIDWIEAFLKKDLNPQKTDSFWCSALCGFIYTKCGLLDSKTDWSILAPNDFDIAQDGIHGGLKWMSGNWLGSEELRLV